MAVVLLFANLVHGVVALAWMGGLGRVAERLSAAGRADLLRLGVVLPPLFALWHAAGLPGPPPSLQVMRAGQWVALLERGGVAVLVVGGVLLGGTALLFLVQEAVPAWRSRRGRFAPVHVRDPRLDAALLRVQALYDRSDMPGLRGHPPRALRLETDALVAGLQGIVDTRIVISRGLLAALDDEELDAAVAHELAHLLRGGNLRLLGVWLLRAVQAFNPATLVLFRVLMETEEAACDAVAVRFTGKPAALASALLKAHGRRLAPGPDAGRLQRARREVLHRADIASTRQRVRALLDEPTPARTGALLTAAAGVLLAVLLGSIR